MQVGLCIDCAQKRHGRTQRCADCRAKHKDACAQWRKKTGYSFREHQRRKQAQPWEN
jgi:hypothetical protein